MFKIETQKINVKVLGQKHSVSVVGEDIIKLNKEEEKPFIPEVINGKDGKDGKDGRDGIDGLDGKDGINGRDGIDGKDGKDGITFIPHYDDKKGLLTFTNDGGLDNPKPIKLPKQEAWGFGISKGGGGQLPSDWNQTDKNNPTFIKNKPDLSDIASKKWVNEQGYIKKAVDDDSTTSETLGWSAKKLNTTIGNLEALILAL